MRGGRRGDIKKRRGERSQVVGMHGVGLAEKCRCFLRLLYSIVGTI